MVKDTDDSVELTRKRKVAPLCPRCASDKTVVDSVKGIVRYCKCNNCDARFKHSAGKPIGIRLAGECPKNPAHEQTRVWSTDHMGQNRCICDDCGTEWTVPVARPPAEG
jgi:transposase-like protein